MSGGSNQSAASAAIPVWLAPAIGSQLKNITTNATTLVKTGAGVLSSISVNTAGTTSTAKVYDGLSAAGTLLGTFDTTKLGLLLQGWAFQTGLCIVTAGGAAADITANYV